MKNRFFSALFLTLLVLGGFSLVLTDWNGMFRGGGITKTDVANVNGTPIKIAEFNSTVARILRTQKMDQAQAYEIGMIDNILQSEILNRIFALSSLDYGLHVEDKYVAQEIQNIISPLIQNGMDKKEALSHFLQMQGMSEKALVQALRNELQTGILKTTIGSANYVPAVLSADISAYKNTAKTIRYIELPNADIKLEKQADEQTLKDYYKTIDKMYMTPETRSFKIAVLDTTSSLKNTTVSNEEIKAFYDENKETYTLPEKRTLEQAILANEGDAQKVAQEARKGTSLEDAVKTVTGSKKAYAGKNDFAKEDLTTEMAGPVFLAAKGDIAGPVKSPLGLHVFKVADISPEHIPPLSDLEKDIKQQLTEEKAGNQIYEITAGIEDRLAAGEAFESFKDEYKLQIYTIENAAASVEKIDVGEVTLTAEQHKALIQKAFSIPENEASTFSDLSGNLLYSVKVEKIVPSSPKEFETVKEEIKKRWEENAQAQENLARAQSLVDSLNEGKTKIENTDKKVDEITLLRSGNQEKNTKAPFDDPRVAGRFLDSSEGKFILSIPSNGKTIIIGDVTSTKLGKTESADPDMTKILQSDTATANLMILVDHLQSKYPIEINRNLIDRVYGSKAAEE